MTLPSVAIVIPTRNRHEALIRCIGRLIPYVQQHPECHFLISDDGDAPSTSAVLLQEFGPIPVTQGPRRGPAANRNHGARCATEDLVVFLDDDCTPDPQLIAAYQQAAISNLEVGVFEGRISAEGEVTTFADAAPSNETGGYLWSCNFAIRRELFLRLGGFDERFPFAAVEDVDFHFRVKNESSVLFLPDARVWHKMERKLGWKVVQHHTLSVLLFLHIHGLEATGKSPVFFLRMAVKSLIYTTARHVRAGTIKYPSYLLFRVWSNLLLALITFFWKSHGALSRWLYPPCCTSCESIHAVLAAPEQPWLPLGRSPESV
ncbi:glycosyltransferase [Acidobacteria bacterium AB60]|nr:glycosyltransferase [Acidobacteria bacterium AB60]